MSIDNKENIRIGDVYMVEFTGVDHEQMGKRPALIFQNNIGNAHCPNVIVLPFTTRMMKKNFLHTFWFWLENLVFLEIALLCAKVL